jgi:hypothetical protein
MAIDPFLNDLSFSKFMTNLSIRGCVTQKPAGGQPLNLQTLPLCSLLLLIVVISRAKVHFRRANTVVATIENHVNICYTKEYLLITRSLGPRNSKNYEKTYLLTSRIISEDPRSNQFRAMFDPTLSTKSRSCPCGTRIAPNETPPHHCVEGTVPRVNRDLL